MGTEQRRYMVDTATLARHAQDVAALGERLENAAKYAQPLSPGAFGLVGQAFTASLIETSGVTAATIARLGTHARADQATLYATLSDYLAHESRTTHALRATYRADTGPADTTAPDASSAGPGASGTDSAGTGTGDRSAKRGYLPGSIGAALDDGRPRP